MAHTESAIPYPPSQAIVDLTWDDQTVHLGGERAGDNWPLTWAHGDLLYAAYGDGHGLARGQLTIRSPLPPSRARRPHTGHATCPQT